MKKCPNCGAQMADDSRYCTECGKELPQENVCPHCGASVNEGDVFCQSCGKNLNAIVDEEPRRNRKSLYALLAVLAAIILIIIGAVYFSDSQERREARLAREQFVKDSIETARKDSIRLEQQREKERREAEIALKKKQMLIPMSAILDMYKHEKDRNYITTKLSEYGYSFFTKYEDGEYWTKDVSLKEMKDEDGYSYYEAVERKGSSALIRDYDLGLSVYETKDFLKWERQLQELGYKYVKYEGFPPDENGWTELGNYGNLCKKYLDSKGNYVEFMKSGDGHPGYDIYTVEFAQ